MAIWVVFLVLISGARGATFTFTNNCEHTVWPGILASAGSPALATTGFALEKGESTTVAAPAGWSGRFWARTLCATDSAGRFACRTGDCGSGSVDCAGSGAAPPATLAEFTLNGAGGLDFYDVSLVDGYNLPVLVVPRGGGAGTCVATGCLVDLNGACPAELKLADAAGDGVACRSACEAFGKPEFCCSGAYATPDTCRPTAYSQFFKNACPRAYSYAYDDGTSTFTCPAGTSYLVTFCPTTAGQKSSEENPQAAPLPRGGALVKASGAAGQLSNPAAILAVAAVGLLL
ncbi:thaumatin-like protein 1 [Wolffia australiana]